uniref:Uncharacterized protein n=1 Tax=Vespula pensylvanica TaxID=30213 RepID=A0A834UGJ0_VESPE|nr:hypothetical protein H0235_000604 [Vespula pensylvanica]
MWYTLLAPSESARNPWHDRNTTPVSGIVYFLDRDLAVMYGCGFARYASHIRPSVRKNEAVVVVVVVIIVEEESDKVAEEEVEEIVEVIEEVEVAEVEEEEEVAELEEEKEEEAAGNAREPILLQFLV